MLHVYLILSFSLLIWSSGFPAISAAVRVYSPMEMTAFRMTVGGVLVLLLCAGMKKRLLPAKRDLLPSALCGLVGIAAYNVLLGYGQQHITAAESSMLVAATPVLTVLASVIFLGERIGWKMTTGMAVSFCGILVMALSHTGKAGIDWGVLLIILAAGTQALLTILQKRMVLRYSALEVTGFCLPWAIAATLPLGWEVFPKAYAQPYSEATLSLWYLAVFSLVIGYVAWAYVLKTMSAAHASCFLYIVPVGSTVMGYLWLGEIPDNSAFIGGGIALIGVAIVNWRRSARKWRLAIMEREIKLRF